MKNVLYLFLVLTSAFGFSQSPDSLKIDYYIGYDCSQTIEGKGLRGCCTKSETIEYNKKKAYKASVILSKESFREWNGGFGANLIEDSITTKPLRSGKKIPSVKFDELMKRICAVTTNTIFSYKKKDIPQSILIRNHLDSEDLNLSEIDSIIREDFNSVGVSSVVSYLTISFYIEGKHYMVWKDPNNIYWSFRPEKMESEYPLHIVCFQLDEFLADHLPKQFSGIKVFN